MRLVYHVISCNGFGQSTACAWNSQEMASSLSKFVSHAVHTIKMSCFPLEIEKNFQAMKSYTFL